MFERSIMITGLLMLAGAPATAAADDAEADRIVVHSRPTGGLLVESPGSISIVDRAQIEAHPADNLADLLAAVAGVDIRRRGASGVQADVGIRGTAYEQTLVLINGIPLKDPQTGHHDLNLPVSLSHIERIEVVRGPGGIAWGGNATGGMINIITRRPTQGEFGVELRAGSFGTRGGQLQAGTGDEQRGHMLSASMVSSDGHLPESRADSDLRRVLYSGYAELARGALEWGLGAEDKEFGAWKFYSAEFPDQREETGSRLAWLSGHTRAADWDVNARLYWRGHDDWFRTLVNDTAFINEHETSVRGVRLDLRRETGQGVLAAGGGWTGERIESNALDNHRREEAVAWLAHRQEVGARGSVEAGLNAIRFSDYGSELLPSLGLGYRLNEHWHAHLSAARTARVPSWTERFLVTGANVGEPDLQPERSTLYEAGLRYFAGEHRLAGALFERKTDALIDWVRQPGEQTWQADNLGGHRGRGAELEWRWQPADIASVGHLDLSWTVLDIRLDEAGREIKYAADHPRHALSLGGLIKPGSDLDLSFQLRWTDRGSDNRGTLLSVRLARQFGRLGIWLEGTNLLDEELVETGFGTIPGRAVFAGIGWRTGR